MGKYYCLIAGLPNIELDDTKLTYTISDFRSELDGVLTPADQKLVDLFYLKYDNINLIQQLKFPDRDPDPRGSITYDEFTDLITLIRDEDVVPANKQIPPYYVEFLRRYFSTEVAEDKKAISPEDLLSSLYYNYAMRSGNDFINQWFELNLNINNILTAITCRKFGMEKADYIVGDNEIAETLRTTNSRDFGLGDSVDYLPTLQRIAEETDLYARERKIDLLKWEWLEENTFFKPFDIESVFAYTLRLEMIERWVKLDRAAGEQTFRELVGTMKKGSGHTLEEFKRNNKK